MTVSRKADPRFYEDELMSPVRKRGRGRGVSKRPPPPPPLPPDQRRAARLETWCAAYDFPLSTMFKLMRDGRGPEITKRGRLNFVLRADWYAWWDRASGITASARKAPGSDVP
jgi:hypothetical protein